MIKMQIMAGGHGRKLQKTLIEFGEDEVKITKMPLIKKHEMLYIQLYYPRVQIFTCILFVCVHVYNGHM